MGGIVLLIGRAFFSFFFILQGFNHLTKLSAFAQYAEASGVPAPTLAVAVSGVMLLAGGLSILLGVRPKVGAAVLVVFLVPTAILVHRFWGVLDPMMAANQAAHFWKNITMTGAALMIYAFAELYPARWPYSLGGGAARATPAL